MNKTKWLWLGSLLLASASLYADSGASGDFKLIVNRGVHATEISRAEARQLWMKNTSRLPDGTEAVPVDQSPGSAVREVFSKEVLGRSTTAMESFWSRQIFSGRQVPPERVKSDAEVIAYVASVPGGLGYVAKDRKLPDSVKEVRVVD